MTISKARLSYPTVTLEPDVSHQEDLTMNPNQVGTMSKPVDELASAAEVIRAFDQATLNRMEPGDSGGQYLSEGCEAGEFSLSGRRAAFASRADGSPVRLFCSRRTRHGTTDGCDRAAAVRAVASTVGPRRRACPSARHVDCRRAERDRGSGQRRRGRA